jgi:hypothetical protein
MIWRNISTPFSGSKNKITKRPTWRRQKAERYISEDRTAHSYWYANVKSNIAVYLATPSSLYHPAQSGYCLWEHLQPDDWMLLGGGGVGSVAIRERYGGSRSMGLLSVAAIRILQQSLWVLQIYLHSFTSKYPFYWNFIVFWSRYFQ